MRRITEQLELDRVRHGWRRPGAGRKPGPNPRIRHRSRESIADRFPCHVTLKVRSDVSSLRTVRLVRELEQTFAASRDESDRSETGEGREPSLPALWARARGSLPRARAEDASRGAQRAGLRAAERAAARRQGGAEARARAVDRSGVLGALI